jgi:hypothetical protein
MYLPKEQEFFFKKALLQSIHDDGVSLPETWEIDKVYKSIYFKYEHRGCRDLRFFVSQNEEDNFFLDYYFITDDYSSHMRINQNGSVIKLENFDGQFGWPVLATEEETENEHERIRLHNQNVQAILISKGLEEKIKAV